MINLSKTSTCAESDEDETLIKAYLKGDNGAFEILYHRYRNAVYRYLYRQLAPPATVEEVFQEVWFAVVKSLPTYRFDAPFKQYIYTLAYHKMLDRVRQKQLTLVNPTELEPLEEPPRSMDYPCNALQQAVADLPIEQRTVVHLKQQGFSTQEISAMTSSPFEGVKSRIRYAYAKLREVLDVKNIA